MHKFFIVRDKSNVNAYGIMQIMSNYYGHTIGYSKEGHWYIQMPSLDYFEKTQFKDFELVCALPEKIYKYYSKNNFIDVDFKSLVVLYGH